MTDATARYVIAADDKTKGAIENIKRNFKELDGAARKLSQGLKGLGIGAVALKAWAVSARLGNEAIQNLAASNVEFAASLKLTEAAMKSAFVAGQLTIEAQAAIAKGVKDPSYAASLRQSADLWGRLKLEAQGLGLAWQIVVANVAESLNLIKSIPQLDSRGPPSRRAALRDLGDVDAAQKLGKSQKAAFDARMKAQADAAKKAADGLLSEVQITAISLFDRTKPFRQDAPRAIDAQQLEDTRFDQFGDSILESTAGIADRMGDIFKEPFDELGPYADQAARNMQDAFANFLFDPFHDGVKGMLRDFADVLRRMAAEVAAAQIFGSKASGGLGLGGLITGAIGALFGGGGKTPSGGGISNFSGPRALGGPVDMGRSYLVGERGPELFTPGRSGMITPNAGERRALTVHVTNNVNAAQLTQDQAARMVADSQRMMWDEMDRRYGIS